MFNQELFSKILHEEGVYSKDPADRGGETVYGIARNLNPKWKGWRRVDTIRGGIGRKKKMIPRYPNIKSDAYDFYKSLWHKYKLNNIQNPQTALYMYDTLVNVGPFAKKLIQRSLGVKEDGQIGPVTVRAINSKTFSEFVVDFARVRMRYYITIQDPRYAKNGLKNKRFIRGWLLRSIPVGIKLPSDIRKIQSLMAHRFRNNADRKKKVLHASRLLYASMA